MRARRRDVFNFFGGQFLFRRCHVRLLVWVTLLAYSLALLIDDGSLGLALGAMPHGTGLGTIKVREGAT
jgi:hypothetical protein